MMMMMVMRRRVMRNTLARRRLKNNMYRFEYQQQRKFASTKSTLTFSKWITPLAAFGTGYAVCATLNRVMKEEDGEDITQNQSIGPIKGRENEFVRTKIENKAMAPSDVDVVIFHGGCPDGFAAAFAAYLKRGDRARYFGIPHGNHKKLPKDVDGKNVCILDFSFDAKTMSELKRRAKSVLVLDHHASARKNLKDLPDENKVFEMKQSGATLAFDFFLSQDIKRCPLLFRYIEDRDIWRWACAESREFSSGRQMCLPIPKPGELKNPHESFKSWKRLFESGDDGVRKLIQTGRLIVKYEDKIVKKESRSAQVRRLKKAPEYRALVVNATSGLASLLGNVLASSERHDVDYAIVARYVPGRKPGEGRWNMSLRSLYGEKGHDSAADVSLIAEKYGGGGHRAAAGMSVPVSDLETLFCKD